MAIANGKGWKAVARRVTLCTPCILHFTFCNGHFSFPPPPLRPSVPSPLPRLRYNAVMSDTDQIMDETVDTSAAGAAEAAEADTSKEIELPADELALRIEAALMATDRPMPAARLSEVLAPPGTKLSAKALTKAVASLNKIYEQSGRSFRIEQLAGGWQILTLPRYADVAAAMNKARQQTKLSGPALETLAIIAYKQPVLKAEIEAIRGVACGEVVRALMERKLVKIVGRAEELGRPMLYGTTKSFLEVFGLSSLKDLPKIEDFKAKASE